MYNLKNSLAVLAVIIIFSACSSNEIGDSKDVAQDKIYQSYSISYIEGQPNAELYCQFRFAGKNGTTLVLNSPSKVDLDGKTMQVDSSKYGGAFYKTQAPIADFYGKHSINFLLTDNKNLQNNFSFDNFKLVNVPKEVSKKRSFNLAFETAPLRNDDYIEVNATVDSSFSVTHLGTQQGNFISIPAKELLRQKGKSISLEATLYRQIPLQKQTSEGGKMEIRYTLKPVTIQLTD